MVIDQSQVILSGFEQLVERNGICENSGFFTSTISLIDNPLQTSPDIIIIVGISQHDIAQDSSDFHKLKKRFPSTFLVVNDAFINYQNLDIFLHLGARGILLKIELKTRK